MRSLLSSMLFLAALGGAPVLAAQAADDPVVYVSQFQVPWERTDSLAKLLRLYPEWLTKARELGHILDSQTWIHSYGDEWNVVQVRTFPSWKAFTDQKPGWGMEVFRMVEPDSTKRAAFLAGTAWVYQGTIHRDNIYVKH